MSGLPKVGATAADLRRMFNDGNYVVRLQAGEFNARLKRTGIVSLGGERCASEVWEYFGDGDVVIACVHCYRRDDGSLAASGRPDPKALLHGGVWYVLKKG